MEAMTANVDPCEINTFSFLLDLVDWGSYVDIIYFDDSSKEDPSILKYFKDEIFLLEDINYEIIFS